MDFRLKKGINAAWSLINREIPHEVKPKTGISGHGCIIMIQAVQNTTTDNQTGFPDRSDRKIREFTGS
jgi:hypothetical protein